MKKDYTHIVLLIDRSGSMSSIRKDMEGGIKSFIDKQKLEPGICTITVAHFDNEYELLFNRVPINEVKDIEIRPRNTTALIDSMARLIKDVGEDLEKLNEDERPERVLFVTITDGEENASREYTNEMLKKLIKEQEDVYSWNFTYIGANQDAFNSASKFGGRYDKSLNYTASSSGIADMSYKLSQATTRFRSMSSNEITKDSFNFTDDELKNV